jgi:glycosyltransferase involved in cell wall biosynthesis
MITTFYPPYNFGGDGIFVQRLSNELARRGHQVEVIHSADSYRLLAGREPAQTSQDHPNVTIHRLRSPFGFLSPLATQQTGRPLLEASRIKRILAQGFDVIHYHNVSLVGGPKVLEYGQGLKLYTLHEYWLVCPTHTLFRYHRAPCVEPHCLTCTLSYGRPPQWWRYTGLLANAVKHVDAFIAPNAFARGVLTGRGLNVPLIDLPYFVPETGPPVECDDDAPPYFLYVGRLEKIKGPQTIIPLFRRYRKARLVVAGAGSDEARLRQLAGGDENIVFLGPQTQEQLKPLYRQAVALIVPSICYEVSPTVIFEAFQQQTPVIARNRGGMPGILAVAHGGLVFETDEDLERALDQLLADLAGRDKMGRRAHQTFTERWTPSAHLDAYLDLIRRLSANRAAPAA